MKLTFHIEYVAAPGEVLCVAGSLPVLGADDENRALALACTDGRHWEGCIETDADAFTYYYILKRDGQVLRREWGEPRRTDTRAGQVFLHDAWRDEPGQRFLYTAPFRDSLGEPADGNAAPPVQAARRLEFLLHCPYTLRGQSVVLLGEGDELGNWDEAHGLPLVQTEHGMWSLVLDADRIARSRAYKFAIRDRATGRVVHWEEGDNRQMPVPDDMPAPATWRHELHYRHGWMNWRAAGVAIPVFSLRSETSYGVGDFADLRLMADWAARTGMKIIQVLPVNDTTITRTWTDSYPYNAISVYALHPLYFGPDDYPLKDGNALRRFRQRADALNALPAYDYEQALALKEEYLRTLYAEQGEAVLAGEPFRCFYDNNQRWLFPYACFCALRDEHHTADYTQWGAHARYDRPALEQWLAERPERRHAAALACFTQYLLHEQLARAKAHAHRCGVTLKGDLPIGISHDSVEAWTEPHLFHLDTQTGAPPDDFSAQGQNWGFPTYDWPRMSQDGYAWWTRRLRHMAAHFDAFRIDHILGFFRIWQIPAHAVQGLLGQFSPALPLTPDEIRAWDVPFDEQRMTRPHIPARLLPGLFGPQAGEAEDAFLNRVAWDRYELKSFCDTQAKVRHLLGGRTDEAGCRLREGLYALCAEVLFVPDHRDPHLYHPRIAAQHTASYADLDPAARQAFDRLHEHYFYQRHNDFWAAEALRKLPALTAATPMLPCGEDLGMIPACVPEVMRRLQILSLEIERMPKQFGQAFEDLAHIPYPSVCATSTHDMSTLRGWWEEAPALTQRYYNDVLGCPGDAPAQCTPEVCRLIVQRHLDSPAMLAILPWQDWLSVDGHLRRPRPEDERINIPASPRHYWRYRMHLTLDSLLRADGLNGTLKELIQSSDRA